MIALSFGLAASAFSSITAASAGLSHRDQDLRLHARGGFIRGGLGSLEERSTSCQRLGIVAIGRMHLRQLQHCAVVDVVVEAVVVDRLLVVLDRVGVALGVLALPGGARDVGRARLVEAIGLGIGEDFDRPWR
jgi:hypothetical protein